MNLCQWFSLPVWSFFKAIFANAFFSVNCSGYLYIQYLDVTLGSQKMSLVLNITKCWTKRAGMFCALRTQKRTMTQLFELAAQFIVSPEAVRLVWSVQKCLPASGEQKLKVEKKSLYIAKVIPLMLPPWGSCNLMQLTGVVKNTQTSASHENVSYFACSCGHMLEIIQTKFLFFENGEVVQPSKTSNCAIYKAWDNWETPNTKLQCFSILSWTS